MHSRRDRRTTCSSASVARRRRGVRVSAGRQAGRQRCSCHTSRSPQPPPHSRPHSNQTPTAGRPPPQPGRTLEQHQFHLQGVAVLVEADHELLHALPHFLHSARHALVAAARRWMGVAVWEWVRVVEAGGAQGNGQQATPPFLAPARLPAQPPANTVAGHPEPSPARTWAAPPPPRPWSHPGGAPAGSPQTAAAQKSAGPARGQRPGRGREDGEEHRVTSLSNSCQSNMTSPAPADQPPQCQQPLFRQLQQQPHHHHHHARPPASPVPAPHPPPSPCPPA